MRLRYVIMGIIILLVYGLLNYHIGSWNLRYIRGFNIKLNAVLYWIIFGFVAMSYVLAEIIDRLMPGRISQVLTLIGSYWFGAFFYSIIIFAFIAVFRIVNKVFNIFTYSQSQGQLITSIVGSLVLILLIGLLAYGTWNAEHPMVKKYNITVDKNAGDIKSLNMVMISDIHLGTIIGRKRLEGMVEKINSLNPDVIFIAGDIIDSNIEPFIKKKMGDILKKLKVPLGVYAAPGNHDNMGGSLNRLIEALGKVGIKMLVDENIKVGEGFCVAGRNDKSSAGFSGSIRKNLDEILAGVDKSYPIILLDHQPVALDEAQKLGVDIQFSGHTHRGQFFPNNIVTSKLFELDWGYLKKGNLHAIVSSGIGTWGPPIRIGNSSEIVQVIVDFSDKLLLKKM